MTTQQQSRRTSPAASSSSPARPPAAAWRSASMCRASSDALAQKVLGTAGQRGRRLGLHQAQRRRRHPHRPLGDGPGHADRPRPARVPRSSSATGRRSRPSIPTPGQNLARNRVWGDMSTGGSRGIRGSHDYVRKGGAAAREMLLQAAADQWKVPVAELHRRRAASSRTPTSRKTTYGKVAARRGQAATPDPRTSSSRTRRTGRSPASRSSASTRSTSSTASRSMPSTSSCRACSTPRSWTRPCSAPRSRATTRPRSRRCRACAMSSRSGDTAVAVVADTWWQANKALEGA